MKQKSGCLFVFAVLAIALLCIIGAVAAILLSPPVTHPNIVIHSPRNDEPLAVNQETVIQAVARDEHKIKRVELWVNDQLLDAQTTNVPGGVSPFPLTVNWRPAISGTYAITVRAFNTQGERAHSILTAQVVARADADGDGVTDTADACLEQAGTIHASGCPDRDRDGVRDTDDACAEQTGASAAQGCPAPTANDRDGDGLLDFADACPDQPGAQRAEGCPDADGDGTQDAGDTCPQEAGAAQNGCPTPGDADGDSIADASDACPGAPGIPRFAGCADDDGDGVADITDACPRESGSAQLAGCPDRDGDAVRDAFDLCPDAPGPTSNSGCPLTGAGDADNDGVYDDVDLVPDQPGLTDHGGSPIPGHGADSNDNQIPDDVEPPQDEVRVFDALTIPYFNLYSIFPAPQQFVQKFMTAVEIQAVSYTALQSPDLTDIACYITLRSTVVDDSGPRIVETVINAPGGLNLDPGAAEREWNLPEVLGERAEHVFVADTDYPINIVVTCTGIISLHGVPPETHELGTLDVTHPSTDWDGHVLWANSTGGDDGRWFHVEYRLCSVSCEGATYRAPALELIYHPNPTLAWLWEGSLEDLSAFGIYRNGAVVGRQPADDPAPPGAGWTPADTTLFYFQLPSSWRPACGESHELYITAYGGEAGAPRESPPSNTVTWTGEPCPRTVRVSFDMVRTGNLGGDERDYSTNGPIMGSFWASASDREVLNFRATVCTELTYCSRSENRHGYRLAHNASIPIQDIFDWIHREQSSCLGNGCESNHYYAPEVNFVVLTVDSDDDITFGGEMMDVDWGRDDASDWDTLFDAEGVISANELVPGAPIVHTLSNREMQMTVRIEVVE